MVRLEKLLKTCRLENIIVSALRLLANSAEMYTDTIKTGGRDCPKNGQSHLCKNIIEGGFMTSTTLKRCALIFMIVDHIGAFIPGAPIWMRWVGRLSFPIFMFIFVHSITLTRDYTKFKKRIFLMDLLMCVIDLIATHAIRYPNGQDQLLCNIFSTFFALLLLLETIDAICKKKEKWQQKLSVYILWQIFSLAISILPLYIGMPDSLTYFLARTSGNLFLNEGNLFWIMIGVIFYYSKHDLFIMSCLYLSVIAANTFILIESIPLKAVNFLTWHLGYFGRKLGEICFGIIGGFQIYRNNPNRDLFHSNYQWMMVFALPLLLFYNGKRRNEHKYFYYLFYPIHIVILTLFSAFLYT